VVCSNSKKWFAFLLYVSTSKTELFKHTFFDHFLRQIQLGPNKQMIFPASVTRQCDDLAHLMGTACLPYLRGPIESQRENSLHSIYDAALQSDAKSALDAIELIHSGHLDSIVPAEGNRSVFAIPLVGTEGENWVAIGRLNEPPNDSARKLLRVAGEAIRRQYQIDSQNRVILTAESELARGSSERNWLRQLNSQRAIRKKVVGQQSRQSIESLRTLIDAEAIAIFMYTDRSQDNHGLESMISGKQSWTRDDVRQLLQRIQKPRCGDSVILNDVDFQLPSGVLRSCVVVPVGESEAFGYVIGLNRRKTSLRQSEMQCGFGPGDAELLHEVSGFLLADAFSNANLLESEKLVLGTLQAMSNAIEARDPYTHGHSERVGSVGYQIALRLHLSEVSCQEVYLAGVLHDIGKIGIPDHVLLKPGKLEPEEFAIIRKHPEIGHRILEELGKLKFALPGVLYHHERVDGTGYPHNLVGDEIPMMARILAVSDAYDAMTSSRVYRTAMGQQRAVDILRSGMRTQWDADVVDACLQYTNDLSLDSAVVIQESPKTKNTDWRQVSQALRVLQL
jgi:HD-GYP domain-containing protein (c-di-GMP phosphodiesterase class II)